MKGDTTMATKLDEAIATSLEGVEDTPEFVPMATKNLLTNEVVPAILVKYGDRNAFIEIDPNRVTADMLAEVDYVAELVSNMYINVVGLPEMLLHVVREVGAVKVGDGWYDISDVLTLDELEGVVEEGY